MEFDWRVFLEEFSRELLTDDSIREKLSKEVIDSSWLGFNGASDDEISTIENRLGLGLPPSYRKFLRITNGWLNTGLFIDQLWSTNEIAWFKERNQDWIDAYMDPYDNLPPISDNEYFEYGDEQDSAIIRVEYLQTALEISDVGDSAIYLLNPKVVTKDGEWEAWFFANWLPGAIRYRSFQELMVGERQAFLRRSK